MTRAYNVIDAGGSVAARTASISSDLLADNDARVEPEHDEERHFRSMNALSSLWGLTRP